MQREAGENMRLTPWSRVIPLEDMSGKANEFKDFKEIPVSRQPPQPVKIRERIHIYDPRPKETVVNSELIKWKPVDIVAARVVAKAPWYCQPPEEEPKYMSKESHQAEVRPAKVTLKTMVNENGVRETLYSAEGVEKMAAGTAISITPKTLSASEELVERAREATDTLRILVQNIGPEWDRFHLVVKNGIAAARQDRIGMDIEVRQLMASLKEVRNFFLEDKHDEEIKRLREFVNLCHQLKELKDSGFLDSVADTILKLS